MSRVYKQSLILVIFYATAIGLIWWGASWRVALGAFILIWASNIENRWKQQPIKRTIRDLSDDELERTKLQIEARATAEGKSVHDYAVILEPEGHRIICLSKT